MKKLRIIDDATVPARGVLKSLEIQHLAVSSDIITETENWSREVRIKHEETLARDRDLACEKAYSDGLGAFLGARDSFLAAADALSGRLEGLLHACLTRALMEAPPDKILRAAIDPLMEELRREATVSLVVHPSQVTVVRNLLQECAADPDVFEVVEDAKLTEADCLIYTDEAVIAVGVPLLVDRLMFALRGHLEVSSPPKKPMETVPHVCAK